MAKAIIGGSDFTTELARLSDMTKGVSPISSGEFKERIAKARDLMAKHGIDVIYLNAGTNMTYFTGTAWYASERMVGAILPQSGPLEYIAPAFEEGSIRDHMGVDGPVNGWQEHESPYVLFADIMKRIGVKGGTIGLDEATAFFISNGLRMAMPDQNFIDAKPVTAGCRMQKSAAEIALIQRAMDMTLEVHKAAARVLKPGISTTDVTSFIHEAHKAVGAPGGSSFCIVLFGEATAYPHGVKNPQNLKEGDMVLIDTGCRLHGYNSDITRSYVFGDPTDRQIAIWKAEKAAQQAAFDAAQLGTPAGDVDKAARKSLENNGFGPDYTLPGLPHRTGHGIGLDIHEWPYLVANDRTPLAPGMCFSNEPMICAPGEFGVRLEDHFYMTDQGPRWFTSPSKSINNPFSS